MKHTMLLGGQLSKALLAAVQALFPGGEFRNGDLVAMGWVEGFRSCAALLSLQERHLMV